MEGLDRGMEGSAALTSLERLGRAPSLSDLLRANVVTLDDSLSDEEQSSDSDSAPGVT